MAARKRRQTPDKTLVARVRETREVAKQRGVLARGRKDRMVSVRLSSELLAEAKRRSGIQSDSKLIEAAVAEMAFGGRTGAWLLRLEGTLPRDFKIDLPRS